MNQSETSGLGQCLKLLEHLQQESVQIARLAGELVEVLRQDRFPDLQQTGTLIATLQTYTTDLPELEASWNQTGLGALPPTLKQLEITLRQALEEQMRAASLECVCQAFLDLQCEAADIAGQLAQEQNRLKKLQEQPEDYECRHKRLQPYARFVQALISSQKSQRRQLAPALRKCFAEELVDALLVGEMEGRKANEELKAALEKVLGESIKEEPEITSLPAPVHEEEITSPWYLDYPAGAIYKEEPLTAGKAFRYADFKNLQHKNGCALDIAVLMIVSEAGVLDCETMLPESREFDLLWKNGYLSRWVVADRGWFWYLSARGEQLYSHEKFQTRLQGQREKCRPLWRADQLPVLEPVSETTAWQRLARLRLAQWLVEGMYKAALKGEMEPCFSGGSLSESTSAFTLRTEEGRGLIALITNPKQPEQLIQDVRKVLAGLKARPEAARFQTWCLAVADYEPERAQAYAGWIQESLQDKELTIVTADLNRSGASLLYEWLKTPETALSEGEEQAVLEVEVSETQLEEDPEAPEKDKKIVQGMLEEKNFPAAMAYANALVREKPELVSWTRQLACGLNDPAAQLSYTAQELLEVFGSDCPVCPEFFSAALLRYAFCQNDPHDYARPVLLEILENQIPACPAREAVLRLLKVLQEFTHVTGQPLDALAPWRKTKTRSLAGERSRLIRTLEDIQKLVASHQRLYTQKAWKVRVAIGLIAGEEAEIYRYLHRLLRENDWRAADEARCFLSEKLLQADQPPEAACIDPLKMERYLDETWEKSRQIIASRCAHAPSRKSEKLMNPLRTWLATTLEDEVRLLVRALELAAEPEPAQETALYKTLDKAIRRFKAELDAISQEGLLRPENPEGQVLLQTTAEILRRLEGSYTNLEHDDFYFEFLRSADVRLDAYGWPLLDNPEGLPELGIQPRLLSFVRKHRKGELPSYADRLAEIFAGQDDYGSAALIAEHLKRTGTPLENPDWSDPLRTAGEENLRRSVEDRFIRFKQTLGLAELYGQLPEPGMREIFLERASRWYEQALADGNYGWLSTLLDASEAHFDPNGARQRKQLLHQQEARKEQLAEKPAWASLFETALQKRNYTGVGELLVQLEAGAPEPGAELENTGLSGFLAAYPELYARVRNPEQPLKRLVSLTGLAKSEREAAERLLESWPAGLLTQENLSLLLEGLGFAPGRCEPLPLSAADQAFYVEAEVNLPAYPLTLAKGFRVIRLERQPKPEELSQLAASLTGSGPLLVIADFAWRLHERRELARRLHEAELSEALLLLDRVLMQYLLLHYEAGKIQETLLNAALPFAGGNPYRIGSALSWKASRIRAEELNQLEDPEGPHLLCGLSQSGKTTLLEQVQSDLHHPEEEHFALLVNIGQLSWKQVPDRLAQGLYETGFLPVPLCEPDWQNLKATIAKHLPESSGRELHLLLDEADTLIYSSASFSWKPIALLESLRAETDGRFRFLLSARHWFERLFASAGGEETIFTRLRSLHLKPLSFAQTQRLFEEPLRCLGFVFSEEARLLEGALLSATGGCPGLLRFCAEKLVLALQEEYGGLEESQTPPYPFGEAFFKRILGDDCLPAAISRHFETLLADPYWRPLLLLAAYLGSEPEGKKSFAASQLKQLADQLSIQSLSTCTTEQIQVLLEELCDQRILTRSQAEGRFAFADSSFLVRLGGRENIEEQLAECLA